jgi:hypothetical protein
VREDETKNFSRELNVRRVVREAEIARSSKGVEEGTSLGFAKRCELILKHVGFREHHRFFPNIDDTEILRA